MKIINQFGVDMSDVKTFEWDKRDDAIVSGGEGHEIVHAWYKRPDTSRRMVLELNKLLSMNLSDNVVYVMPKGYGNELYTDDEMIESYEKYKEKTEKE